MDTWSRPSSEESVSADSDSSDSLSSEAARAHSSAISYDDPRWNRTFPHLVEPLTDEWLPGLLLRCDAANGWGAGTTAGYCAMSATDGALSVSPNRPAELVFGGHLNLSKLAALLALPHTTVEGTTYRPALERLFGTDWSRALSAACQLGPTDTPRVCPLCLRIGYGLRTFLAWSLIQHCPLHLVRLANACVCSHPICYYPRSLLNRGKVRQPYAQPFTCQYCQRSWRTLPILPGTFAQLANEQAIVRLYQFFLSADSFKRYAQAQFTYQALISGWSFEAILAGYSRRQLRRIPSSTKRNRGKHAWSVTELVAVFVWNHVTPSLIEQARVPPDYVTPLEEFMTQPIPDFTKSSGALTSSSVNHEQAR